MIAYILHVTVITTICFLFYKLLLQKETFYRLNRWMLMGCLAVSFGLPLLPVPQAWSWRYAWVERRQAVSPLTGQGQGQPMDQVKKQGAGLPGTSPVIARQTNEVSTTSRHGIQRMKNSTAIMQETKGKPAGQQLSARWESSAPAPGAAAWQLTGLPGKIGQGNDAMGNAQGNDAVGNMQQHNAVQNGQQHDAGITGPPSDTRGSGQRTTGSSGTVVNGIWFALQWFFYAYLFGVVLFGANFLLQLAVLLFQSYARPVIRDGRFRIVEVNGNRAPCSFGNTIFINPANYDWDTYNQILIHEKIHVSGRHTVDILLAETAVVLQWFNPFVWLYRREVENNLEFLTDASVLLHQEVERSAYQLSLLRVSAPHMPFSITNNYNQSLLKRRIVMILFSRAWYAP
jgi:hypothetical protein